MVAHQPKLSFPMESIMCWQRQDDIYETNYTIFVRSRSQNTSQTGLANLKWNRHVPASRGGAWADVAKRGWSCGWGYRAVSWAIGSNCHRNITQTKRGQLIRPRSKTWRNLWNAPTRAGVHDHGGKRHWSAHPPEAIGNRWGPGGFDTHCRPTGKHSRQRRPGDTPGSSGRI